jgi:hypothetical protein
MVLDVEGKRAHKKLSKDLCSFAEEDASFKEKVQETVNKDGTVKSRWVKLRAVPESNLWFETA